MKENQLSIREYLEKFNKGAFHKSDVGTQIDAGWYDWFCRDGSLRNKTYSLTRKLSQIVGSEKINIDTMYVFFKNNCPVVGKLYDDFRICDMKTGDVIYTITPAVGYKDTYGRSEVWGSKENDFKEPIVAGTWNDVLFFFLGVDKEKEREEKRKEREKAIRAAAERKINTNRNKIMEWIRSRSKCQLEVLLVNAIGEEKLYEWAKTKRIIK